MEKFSKWFFNFKFNRLLNIDGKKFLMESFLFIMIFIISNFANILMVLDTSQFNIIETFSWGFMIIVWITLIMWRIFKTKYIFHWLYIALIFDTFLKRFPFVILGWLTHWILSFYFAFIIIYILTHFLFNIEDTEKSLRVINELRKIKPFTILDDYMMKLNKLTLPKKRRRKNKKRWTW